MKTEAKRTLPRKEAKAIERREREREKRESRVEWKIGVVFVVFSFPGQRQNKDQREKRESASEN
jgi:hypothetical protein